MRVWRDLFALSLAIVMLVFSFDGARAQGPVPAILREVSFEQKLNAQTPLDVPFRDEAGNVVRLRDYLRGKPLVLTLNYLHCRNLCPLILDSVVGSLSDLSLDIGRDFDVLTVSIDPRELPSLAATKKNIYLKRYARAGADDGWHFLTAEPASIDALTEAVGFHYTYDARQDEYAHPAGIVVLTPDGRVSRYLYGPEIPSQDMRLALVEASERKIGTPLDQFLLVCYRYDPQLGRYSAIAMDVTRMAGAATVVLLAGFLFTLWRRERQYTPRAQ